MTDNQQKKGKKTTQKKGTGNVSNKEGAPSVKILEVTGNKYFRHSIDITSYKIALNGYYGQILTLRHTAKPKLLRRKTLNSKDYYLIPYTSPYMDGNVSVVVASDYNNAKKIVELYKIENAKKYSSEDILWNYCDHVFDCIDGVFENNFTGISYKVNELGLNESGKESYDANLSVFDEKNNLLASFNYDLTIQYNHKMIGKDEVKVVS